MAAQVQAHRNNEMINKKAAFTIIVPLKFKQRWMSYQEEDSLDILISSNL